MLRSKLHDPTVLNRKYFYMNLIRTIIFNKYSGWMKITSPPDQISHCKTTSGSNWSNRWTYRVSTIHSLRYHIVHSRQSYQFHFIQEPDSPDFHHLQEITTTPQLALWGLSQGRARSHLVALEPFCVYLS